MAREMLHCSLRTKATYTDYAKAIVFGTSSETTLGLVLRTGTSTSSIAFADNSGSGSGAQDGLIEYSQTDRALLSTATSEQMRIDSSGRLLHGTNSSVTANSETRNVQIVMMSTTPIRVLESMRLLAIMHQD